MQNIQEWKPTIVIKSGKGYKPVLSKKTSTSFYVIHKKLNFYVRYIREHSRGRLLDCGCGPVPYYELYHDLVEEVICTDWQNSIHGHRFADVLSDLNEHLNFNDLSFDTVILTDVLEHIYQPKKLLSEIHRVLKPGGRVIIAVPFIYRIHEEPHDYFRYSEFALKKLCAEAGLSINELEPYGGYMDILFDMMNKVFFRNRFLVKMMLPFSNLINHSWINKKINKAHQGRYPLGYILCAEKTT